jgi:hypothetical protein
VNKPLMTLIHDINAALLRLHSCLLQICPDFGGRQPLQRQLEDHVDGSAISVVQPNAVSASCGEGYGYGRTCHTYAQFSATGVSYSVSLRIMSTT